MTQKLGIFVALLVFICSINVKVVKSQLSFGNRGGFSNAYSAHPLGTSLNFASPKDWHHTGSGPIFIGNSDTFNNWPTANFPRPSSGWNRNTGMFGFTPINTNFDDQKDPFTPLKSEEIDKIRSSYALLPMTTKSTTSRTTEHTKPTTTTPFPEYERFHSYGNTFGRNWLLKNTYLARNHFYDSEPPYGPGPLTKALFLRDTDGSESSDSIKWDKSDDKKWRATTRAPYFENKVPGEDKILPASAVDGAATAFGLFSLFPLSVPSSKPLMYCGNTNLKQRPIQIFDEIYICKNGKFEISCEENFRNQSDFKCPVQEMNCDLSDEESTGDMYCKDGTLFSKLDTFCDKTILINETDEAIIVLNCQEGLLSKHLESFVPTTSPRTTTTQEPKPLSIKAKAHIFLLKLMGKHEVLEKETTTTETYPFPEFNAWHPEALTFAPERTTRMP